ncbi:hypothetical protein DAMA08_049510 [Martiniozyma asiatica (nom. inval.)]|nr:hypothetical protein DAMA08_049510 [Martiniozyma asiatica]
MSNSVTSADLDELNLNTLTNAEQQADLVSTLKEIHAISYEERLSLPAPARIALFSLAASSMGAFGGMVHGWSQASLKYLAANAHRLPTSYNGWFFYHKRKTYYCTKNAMSLAFSTGARLGFWIGGIFSLEAGLDWIRGRKDFVNTTMACVLPGFGYAWFKGLGGVQAKELIHKGGKIGLILGLSQDGLNIIRGVDVWWLDEWFGVKPMPLDVRVRKLRESIEANK